MDQLLQMIQSADPTDNQSDSVELLQLEGKTEFRVEVKKANGTNHCWCTGAYLVCFDYC